MFLDYNLEREQFLPDGRWKVTLETRQRGAIGTFEPREFIVRAAGRDQCRRFAIDEADLQGFEPRNVLSAEFLGKWSAPYVPQ